ncbi:MAG: lasso peptide biosynthesis B2 protein [Candidatus Acidiferrales bacterium]
MRELFLEAYSKLVLFDFYVGRRSFEALIRKVREYRRVEREPGPGMMQRGCSAVDVACIWYWKEVLCLQRSAATACLLRQHGIPARLVIGAQQMPFKAHAWVEVGGQVVNDKPYVSEIYAVLDKC